MKKQAKETIVIIGFGWVGQANALALADMGYPVFYYDVVEPKRHYIDTHEDLYQKVESLSSPLEKDSADTWYFLCVGDRVSEEGEQDVSLIQKASDSLKGSQGNIILRSTVLPDNLETINFDYYLPEFLHEKKAVKECRDPHYFVIGTRNNEAPYPSFLKEWEERSHHKPFRGTPKEASHIKYLSNIWNALRIAFVNEFGRSMHVTFNDEEDIQRADNILKFLFGDKGYLQYGRAFGGNCLPKDVRAYKAYCEKHMNPAFLQGVLASNEEHEKFQAQYADLSEHFSPWRRVDISGRAALKALGRSIRRSLRQILRR